MPADKPAAQFWTALLSVLSLAIITMVSLVCDMVRDGRDGQVTMLLIGGLISLCSSSASWLFRNGNGYGYASGPDVTAAAPVNLKPDHGPP